MHQGVGAWQADSMGSCQRSPSLARSSFGQGVARLPFEDDCQWYTLAELWRLVKHCEEIRGSKIQLGDARNVDKGGGLAEWRTWLFADGAVPAGKVCVVL